MHRAPPLVSIIVPAFGLAHLVSEAIESVLAQTMADWEAIVMDDGAPDDVAAAVRPYLVDPRIRFLSTDNRGLPTARNRAIAAASAPLIALLDADDRYAPTYLATMTAVMQANPELGFATCDALYFGASRVGERFSSYTPQQLPLTLDRVLARAFNIFVASVIRREAFDAVGGFAPDLRAAEDFDLWIRLLTSGWQGGYVNAPLAHYRRRPGSMSADTGRLLRAELTVFDRAATSLHGRAEAATALCMRDRIARDLAVVEGEAMVLSGDVRAGMQRLRDGKPWRGSLKWSLAMPILAIPGLARPMLAARARRNNLG